MKRCYTLSAQLRAEDALILASIRPHWGPQDFCRISAILKENLNWEYIQETATRQGVLPLLYNHLQAAFPEAVPPQVLVELRECVKQNTAWNVFLTSELLHIVSLLEAYGITAVPYKGPVLAHLFSGDLSLRQFKDLDILVSREEVLEAKDLLLAQGYQSALPLTREQEVALLKWENDFTLVHPIKGVLVELHWEITPKFLSFPVRHMGLWERLVPIQLGGKTLMSLAPEDLLLVICVHSTKHTWESLGWIRDVAALVDRCSKRDWGRILERARRGGCLRILLLGLHLAVNLAQVEVPEEIAQMLKDDFRVKGLGVQVRQKLFPIHSNRDFLSTIHFQIKVRERWKDKLLYCGHFLFTPSGKDLARLKLPGPLYPFSRPFRLLQRYLLGEDKPWEVHRREPQSGSQQAKQNVY